MRFLLKNKSIISTIIFSFIVPVVLTINTVNLTLKQEIDKGHAVFESIGYRYFAAIVSSYNPKTLMPFSDPSIQINFSPNHD